MYKPLLRKTQAFILSLTMVFAVLSVPYSVPVKAANSTASVIAEWYTTVTMMETQTAYGLMNPSTNQVHWYPSQVLYGNMIHGINPYQMMMADQQI